LNDWLRMAPNAQAICSQVGAAVFINDAALRPATGLEDNSVIETGKHRFRFRWTPHLPHGWDAGMLFDETTRTLFCSDLFHHGGNVEPRTESDVVGRSRDTIRAYQASPFRNYLPFTPNTQRQLQELAELRPQVCATMHGSAFAGDGSRALLDFGGVLKEVFG
jgi:flavorubredoxin